MICKHCGREQDEPKGYTLVSVNGANQRVADNHHLAPKTVFVNQQVGGKRTRQYAEPIDVVCVVEREA